MSAWKNQDLLFVFMGAVPIRVDRRTMCFTYAALFWISYEMADLCLPYVGDIHSLRNFDDRCSFGASEI